MFMHDDDNYIAVGTIAVAVADDDDIAYYC